MFNTTLVCIFLCFCCCLTHKSVANITKNLSGKEEIQSQSTAMFICSRRVHLGHKSWSLILLLAEYCVERVSWKLV